MSTFGTEDSALEALKARQGKGARYDASNAPAEDLLLARRGTAYFARKLMELSDEELFGPSVIYGCTRAHVVAKVCYDARHQALALEALIKGGVYKTPSDEEQQLPSLDLAVTLPARALRHLFSHSEIHLNVCWRDLAVHHWDADLTLTDDRVVSVRNLPMARAETVWLGAFDLANGAQRKDLPERLRR